MSSVRPAVPESSRATSIAVVAGVSVAVLGLWGGLVPFAGPTFGYAMGSSPAWSWTESHATLHVAPALAAIAGGLVLVFSRRRALVLAAAGLATVAGAWFVVGPSLHSLWASSGSARAVRIGSTMGGARATAVRAGTFGMASSGTGMASSGTGMASGARATAHRTMRAPMSATSPVASGRAATSTMGNSTMGNSTMGVAEAIGYHYGTGVLIAVLGALALGALVVGLPAAVRREVPLAAGAPSRPTTLVDA